MRQDGRPGRGWARRDRNPATEPKTVIAGLDARQLRDLETCRSVWNAEQDPLALCEAVRLSDLPEWLRDGLLVLLTDGTSGLPAQRARLWRDRTRHATDRSRVEASASAKALLPEVNGEEVTNLANRRVGQTYTGTPDVTPAAMRKAHARVVAGLTNAPGRYYIARAGMSDAITAAWYRYVELLRQRVPRRNQPK